MTSAEMLSRLRDHIDDTASAVMSDAQCYSAIRFAVDFCNRHYFPTNSAPFQHDGAAVPAVTPVPTYPQGCVIVGVAACRILWPEYSRWRTSELQYQPMKGETWRDAAERLVALAKQRPGSAAGIKFIQTIGIDEHGIPDQYEHEVDTYTGAS